ncbi:WD40 repeat-containing protein [Cynara cardunculus var. scolymus]|uniref:WD40 repeat-containing protein n=1 Tax=Cynara cardunculus var. scolymus TaxID=59895 RepID=A0A103XEC5_CYNCS|nr:WD40 repeat-containing protein [Cynara cardunculus var. scolymus]
MQGGERERRRSVKFQDGGAELGPPPCLPNQVVVLVFPETSGFKPSIANPDSESVDQISSSKMEGIASIAVVSSLILGALIAFIAFGSYFRKRKSEVVSVANPAEAAAVNLKNSRPQQNKKSQSKPHHSHADKDSNKRHHPLDLNTLKGHGDSVNGLCFSSDGHSLATAPRIMRTNAMNALNINSVKPVSELGGLLVTMVFLRINLPAAGGHPTAVAFVDDSSSIVVASQNLTGASLYMYGEDKPKGGDTKQQSKPEIKWEHHNVHDKKYILTLFGTKATHGAADGSTIIASRTDIILWHGKSGKMLGNVDTNQLKNNMATVSPNGRFIAAAAFTADVKVWEIVYSKDSSVKEVTKVMQLKGHKSAVTWLCFTPDSERIITASKDGSIRVWNINVRYHLDEDPKTLKVLPIPLHDSKGTTLQYDRLSISPDGKILAATHGSILQWLSAETGEVLETADKAHDGDITDIAWAPKPIPVGDKRVTILATSSVDKKVKLWAAPTL